MKTLLDSNHGVVEREAGFAKTWLLKSLISQRNQRIDLHRTACGKVCGREAFCVPRTVGNHSESSAANNELTKPARDLEELHQKYARVCPAISSQLQPAIFQVIFRFKCFDAQSTVVMKVDYFIETLEVNQPIDNSVFKITNEEAQGIWDSDGKRFIKEKPLKSNPQ